MHQSLIKKVFIFGFFTLITSLGYFFAEKVSAEACSCSCQSQQCTDLGSTCSIRNYGSRTVCHTTKDPAATTCDCSVSCTYYYCRAGNCISDDYNANYCTVSTPPSCTNTCPCTASNKAAPWINGTAPSGYIAACRDTTSCSGRTSTCGNCNDSKSWYLPNPMPVAPPAPTVYEYCINGSCTPLSTNPANPSIFNLPSASDVVVIRTNLPTVADDGRGIRYKYQLDNLVDGFNAATCGNGSSGFPYDRCQTDISIRDTWGLSNMVNIAGLSAPSYSIKFNNGILRECTDEVIYENSNIKGYFKYNRPPSVVSISKPVSLSGTQVDTDNATTCSDQNPFTFTITYRDLDGNAELSSMRFWLDSSAPAANQVNSSVHGAAAQNGAIFRLQGYLCDTSGNNCSWTLFNDSYNTERSIIMTQSGYRDVLPGQPGSANPLGSATILSTNRVSATDIAVTFKVWIDSDIAAADTHLVNVYAYALDRWGLSSNWQNTANHQLDFAPPQVTMPTDFTIIGNNSIQVDWSVNDAITSVTNVWGGANYISNPEGSVRGPISNLAVGATKNYRIDDPTETRALWQQTGSPVTNGSEQIDLQLNMGNEIGFYVDAVDLACNMGSGPTVSQNLGDAWLISKGGNVYSQGGTDLNPKSVTDDGKYLTADNSLWIDPFRFKVDDPTTVTQNGKFNDVAPSTGFYGVSVGSLAFPSHIDNPALGFALTNYSNNKLAKPLYNDFDENSTRLFAANVANVIINGSLTLNTSTQNSTADIAGCEVDNRPCLVRISGDLNIQTTTANTPFVCDRAVVFLVNGRTNIQPNIIKGTEPFNGCMVISRGAISITTGQSQTLNPACNATNLSNSNICYPKYDKLELFMYSDSEILINDDPRPLISEGLVVHGSMIALGEGSGAPAIKWGRTLQLAGNARFPSVAAHYDPVYLWIARSVFYFDYPAYSVDVGYKVGE